MQEFRLLRHMGAVEIAPVLHDVGDHCHSVNPHARRDEDIKVTTAFPLSLRDSGELG